MDRGKQRAASPPPPRAAYSGDLDTYLQYALSLGGGASSSAAAARQEPQMLLQERYATPTSPLMLPSPAPSQQGGGGGVGLGGLHPLMQQHQMAQMRGTQQPPPSTYCVGEGSPTGGGGGGGGYFWPMGGTDGGFSPAATNGAASSNYAMPYPAADRIMPLAAANGGSSGNYLSRFGNGNGNGYANQFAAAAAAAAAAAPRPQVVPRRQRTLRASASQYQPIGASSRSASMASSSTSRHHHHNSPASSNYHRRPEVTEQDYQECLQVMNALRADQGDPSWRATPRISEGRSLEEVRDEMLRGPMPLGIVFFQNSAGHVIRLLEEGIAQGSDQYRLSALAGIKPKVHEVMEDKEGCQVFVVLMRACAERKDEIHAIIAAAAPAPSDGNGNGNSNGNGRPKTTQLLRVARQDYGETSLRALIAAAAPFPDLCKLITDCLVCERVMDNLKGDRLLSHCFTTMNYEDSKILIKFARYHANRLLSSSSGSRCLAECYLHANGEELEDLEHLVLENASLIAKGHYSNYFLQTVLEFGSDRIKRDLVALLMADVASLSRQRFGSYVIEACFILTGSPDLLRLVLDTFLGLADEQIADVIQCNYGNYVVQKLVDNGKDAFPKETMTLVRRIERMPVQMVERGSGNQVMKAIRRLFPRQPRLY